jgi:septum formation protein
MGLILASRSPRRRRLLGELGVVFDVVAPAVVEVVCDGEIEKSVAHNAALKCAWCRARYPGAAVIAADTGISLDGHVVMKPVDRAEAARFLAACAGRSHTVMTGVALYAPPDAEPRVEVVSSRVRFRELTRARIEAYPDRVNPLDRAGAYDINDHGDMVVAGYEGSYSNIMGLPMEVVTPWCKAHGMV